MSLVADHSGQPGGGCVAAEADERFGRPFAAFKKGERVGQSVLAKQALVAVKHLEPFGGREHHVAGKQRCAAADGKRVKERAVPPRGVEPQARVEFVCREVIGRAFDRQKTDRMGAACKQVDGLQTCNQICPATASSSSSQPSTVRTLSVNP